MQILVFSVTQSLWHNYLIIRELLRLHYQIFEVEIATVLFGYYL